MTEIMFMMRDFPDPDPNVHVRRLHRGDVICWRVDGWRWSEAELKNPKFRIIRLDLTQTEVAFLASGEDDPFNNKIRTWVRVRKINFDDSSVKGNLKTAVEDSTRSTQILQINNSKALNPLIVEKGNAEDRI